MKKNLDLNNKAINSSPEKAINESSNNMSSIQLNNPSPQIRLNAFKEILKCNKDFSQELAINDPFYKIRILGIKNISDQKTLLKFIKDQNTEIKIETLKRIKECIKEEIITEIDSVLISTCFLINDRNESVRIEYSRLLKSFKSTNVEFCKRLFDKNDIGLFIYGAEDEISKVRLNVIKAVPNFPVDEGVDYLVDFLNEDSKEVRLNVIKALRKIMKRIDDLNNNNVNFNNNINNINDENNNIININNINNINVKKHKLSKNQAKYILNLTEENIFNIQKYILEIISKITFFDIEIFTELFKKTNILESLKFKYLIKIVKKNPQVFLEHLKSNFSYKILKTNYSTEYLIMLFSLIESKHIDKNEVSKKLLSDLKFIKMKLFNFSSKKVIRESSKIYKEFFIELEKKKIIIDGILQKDISDKKEYFCKISNEMNIRSEDSEEFLKLLYEIFCDLSDSCDNNSYNNSYDDNDNNTLLYGIFNYRFILPQNLKEFWKISKIAYALTAPETVFINPGSYIIFSVETFVSHNPPSFENIKFIVSDSSENCMKLDFSEKIKVCLFDNCKTLFCFIGLIYENEIIALSEKKRVEICMNDYSL